MILNSLLEYIEIGGSVDDAITLAQMDRTKIGWEARSAEGHRLRNAENYLAAYVTVENGDNTWAGRSGTAGALFWFVPAYHVVNLLTFNNLRPHSPASTDAIHASWAGFRDGSIGRPRGDPDCGCEK